MRTGGKKNREIIERAAKWQRDHFWHKEHKKPKKKTIRRDSTVYSTMKQTSLCGFIFLKNDLYCAVRGIFYLFHKQELNVHSKWFASYKIFKIHCTYNTLHAPYMHCTKLLINEFYKRTIDATKYFYLRLYKLVQCMCGACMVHVWCRYGAYMVLYRVHVGCMYGENIGIVQCLFGASTVHVRCIHDQDYSKQEQQTRPPTQLEWKWSCPIGKQRWWIIWY